MRRFVHLFLSMFVIFGCSRSISPLVLNASHSLKGKGIYSLPVSGNYIYACTGQDYQDYTVRGDAVYPGSCGFKTIQNEGAISLPRFCRIESELLPFAEQLNSRRASEKFL